MLKIPHFDILFQAKHTPRFHGNGFIQLYLSSTTRLHVFHPSFPPKVTNSLIHDHRWDMHSHVLLGQLTHSTYKLTPMGFMSVYEAPEASKAHSLERKGSNYNTLFTGRNTFAAGSEYWLPQHEFHTSEASELTMTFIEKSNQSRYPCRIVAPTNETPDHAFGYTIPPSAMWSAIEEAYDAYGARHGHIAAFIDDGRDRPITNFHGGVTGRS